MVGERTTGVVIAEEGHAAIMAEFVREVWDRDATRESVLRGWAHAASANPLTPGIKSPTFLFVTEGRVLGHFATIPAPTWFGGETLPAHWVKGLMVLPEARNGPVGYALVREATRHVPLAMAMVVQPEPRRLFEALGFTDVGTVPNFMALLDPGKVIRRLDLDALGIGRLPRPALLAVRVLQRPVPAWGAGLVLRAAAHLARFIALGTAGRGEVTTADELSVEGCDRLWDRIAAHVSAAPARSGVYLRARYGGKHGSRYVVIALQRASGIEGVAVVRRPAGAGDSRLRGIRIAVLAELLFSPDDPRAGRAALGSALTAARDMGADALLCSASHRSMVRLLRRAAFLPVPGNVHFLVRFGGPPVPPIEDWWLTRGDSEMDEVF